MQAYQWYLNGVSKGLPLYRLKNKWEIVDQRLNMAKVRASKWQKQNQTQDLFDPKAEKETMISLKTEKRFGSIYLPEEDNVHLS